MRLEMSKKEIDYWATKCLEEEAQEEKWCKIFMCKAVRLAAAMTAVTTGSLAGIGSLTETDTKPAEKTLNAHKDAMVFVKTSTDKTPIYVTQKSDDKMNRTEVVMQNKEDSTDSRALLFGFCILGTTVAAAAGFKIKQLKKKENTTWGAYHRHENIRF